MVQPIQQMTHASRLWREMMDSDASYCRPTWMDQISVHFQGSEVALHIEFYAYNYALSTVSTRHCTCKPYMNNYYNIYSESIVNICSIMLTTHNMYIENQDCLIKLI